jgi:hypothetical protein
MQELYATAHKSIWVLYDLRDPKACRHLHEQRWAWQERSDLVAVGPDHMILVLSPLAARLTPLIP